MPLYNVMVVKKEDSSLCIMKISIVLNNAVVLNTYGLWGVWITSGVTWTVTAVVCVLRYASGVWKIKGIVLAAN